MVFHVNSTIKKENKESDNARLVTYFTLSHRPHDLHRLSVDSSRSCFTSLLWGTKLYVHCEAYLFALVTGQVLVATWSVATGSDRTVEPTLQR